MRVVLGRPLGADECVDGASTLICRMTIMMGTSEMIDGWISRSSYFIYFVFARGYWLWSGLSVSVLGADEIQGHQRVSGVNIIGPRGLA